ncbi:hypothetical protein HT105_25340, partial [Bacteroides fragilis]|nr:hypothetical protein [Bacteroides fragilis]
DNTGWSGKAATFNASLGALLDPKAGYGNPYLRQFSRPALVADNTGWSGKAATFNASLGALLDPKAGYGNPYLR